MNKPDEGLNAIIKVFEEIKPNISEELLLECYRIEQKFQFHLERQLSLDSVKEIVMEEIKKERL